MTAQPTRKQIEQAAARAYATAWPAAWEFGGEHLELVLHSTPVTEVRLLVWPPCDSPTVGQVCVMVGGTTGRTSKGETFGASTDSPPTLPVECVGRLIAEVIAHHPGAVDFHKIPEWAKAATADALTPHRQRIEKAQDVLRATHDPTPSELAALLGTPRDAEARDTIRRIMRRRRLEALAFAHQIAAAHEAAERAYVALQADAWAYANLLEAHPKPKSR